MGIKRLRSAKTNEAIESLRLLRSAETDEATGSLRLDGVSDNVAICN